VKRADYSPAEVRLTCELHSMAEIQIFLHALQCVDELQLRRGKYPSMYEAGVVHYQREKRGHEEWQTARDMMRTHQGDCEDLAAWRAAELRASGVDKAATAIIKRIHTGLIHCLVRRGDGTIEDPSKRLGMGRNRKG